MKKVIIFLVVLFFNLILYSQEKSDTIYISTDKFVTISFPSKVEYYQNSVSINDQIGIKSVDENLFLQYLTKNVPETNLLVKTIDNKYYSFILKYSADPKKLYVNIGTKFHAPSSEKGVKANPEKPEKNTLFSVEEKILKERGYLKSRNIASKKGIRVILKGVYVNADKLYFLVNIKNSSNVSYDIESFKFFITNKAGTSSLQSTEMPIILTTPHQKNIKKEDVNFVFTFNKFTISQDKVIKFEIFEKGGDRNISFPIIPTIIDEAKSIN